MVGIRSLLILVPQWLWLGILRSHAGARGAGLKGRTEDKEDIVWGQQVVLREKQVSNSSTKGREMNAEMWSVHTWDIVHTKKRYCS